MARAKGKLDPCRDGSGMGFIVTKKNRAHPQARPVCNQDDRPQRPDVLPQVAITWMWIQVIHLPVVD